MMQVIEPQFQRDFISLLPKEVSQGKSQAGPTAVCWLPAVGACSAIVTWLLLLQLALYVLSFLEPRDLLRAAQTCRYWRVLAEDNLLWREKCREEGKDLSSTWHTVAGICSGTAHSCHCCAPSLLLLSWGREQPDYCQELCVRLLVLPAGIEEPLNLRKRRLLSPGFMYSPWKFAFMRQHKIDMNWRSGELKAPKVSVFSSVC